jgi:hypothetical protein
MVQATKPAADSSADDAEAALEQLSVGQQEVLALLTEGKSICAAAETAGVGCNTVTRWIRRHPAFRVVYNAWRRELLESTNARLLRAAESAAGVIQTAIDNGDAKLALSLIKHMGAGHPAPIGPTDINLVADEVAIADREEAFALDERANKMKFNVNWDSERETRKRIREKHEKSGPNQGA